jgi:hypothetical protein
VLTEEKPAAASAPATAAEEDDAVDASAGISAPVIDKEWDEDDWDAAAEDVLAVRFLHICICGYV